MRNYLCCATLLLWLASPADAQDTKTLHSKDNRVGITVPAVWETTVFKEANGQIQAKSEENTCLIVISESKEKLPDKSIGEYAEHILKLEATSSKLVGRTVTGPAR